MEDATANTTPKTIDERFDEVQQAFLDQRDYTTFCFDKLRSEMRGEFDKVEGEFKKVQANFRRIDANFGRVEANVGRLEANFGRVERRLDRHEELLGVILTEVRALKRK